MFPPSLARGEFTCPSAAHKAAENGARLAESRPPRPARPVAHAGPEASLSLPQAILTGVPDQVGDPLGDLSDVVVGDPARQFVPDHFEEGVVLAVMGMSGGLVPGGMLKPVIAARQRSAQCRREKAGRNGLVSWFHLLLSETDEHRRPSDADAAV
jgi:hypothetical protein